MKIVNDLGSCQTCMTEFFAKVFQSPKHASCTHIYSRVQPNVEMSSLLIYDGGHYHIESMDWFLYDRVF